MPLSLSRISLDASLASLSLYRFSILSPPVRPVAPWSQEPSPSSADSSLGKPEGLKSMGWRAGVQDLRCRAGKWAATVVRSGISAGHAGRAPLLVCAAPSPRGWELRRVRVGKQDACKQDSPACGRASSNDTWLWWRRSSSFASWLASRAEAGMRSAHGSPAEATMRSARDRATRAPTLALR